ncbi:MAG: bifunctional 4-hydroxy-2-oxoglutarate aldolase/2-dehydro-3-deoxy-phosphogluconate aldolase [Leptolyngbya sp. LCM1.Bin17]|nr:MAG: bifunctional 4-hydroxy-2-oxoglutarate aldolase/2-dehydro-3-deoxy-phosphogluconate aldolase [Leptolyngbya sp. LCM1.Bin17]
MTSDAFLTWLRQHRAIAVIRAPSPALGVRLAQAAAAGGMRMIEITWNSEQPAQIVAQLRQQLPHCAIGVGTLLTLADLKNAQAAGAMFGFGPYTAPDLLAWAQTHDLPLVPGALTPNEIVRAWQVGAPAVKVFPIRAIGGADYIRSLQGPLGHIPLVPTGGVTVDAALPLLQAGAIGVGLSSGLFAKTAVLQEDWGTITTAAARLVTSLSSNPQVG